MALRRRVCSPTVRRARYRLAHPRCRNVTYDQSSGTVEAIGLKSTRIRGLNGELRIVANKQLLEKEIQNNTRRDHRRIKFAPGAVYQTPPEVCGAHSTDAAGNRRAAADVRAVWLRQLLDFEVEFDSPHADFQHAYDARHEVGLAILQLQCEGIEFAYPTQTSFTAAPDGRAIMPYPDIQAVKRIDLRDRPEDQAPSSRLSRLALPPALAGIHRHRPFGAEARQEARPAALRRVPDSPSPLSGPPTTAPIIGPIDVEVADKCGLLRRPGNTTVQPHRQSFWRSPSIGKRTLIGRSRRGAAGHWAVRSSIESMRISVGGTPPCSGTADGLDPTVLHRRAVLIRRS